MTEEEEQSDALAQLVDQQRAAIHYLQSVNRRIMTQSLIIGALAGTLVTLAITYYT